MIGMTPAQAKAIIDKASSKSATGELLFVTRLRETGFTDVQIATVLSVHQALCETCLDADDMCYCHPIYSRDDLDV
jgi:hypothetical protein